MATVLHEEVLDVLGRRIVDGELGAGEAITLAAICAEFGVSRTVAREAMRSLEQMGMVRPRPRVGIVVQETRRWRQLSPRLLRWHLDSAQRERWLTMIAQIRIALEPLAARLAAENADDAEREHFARLAAGFEADAAPGVSLEDFLEHDQEFHELLVAVSGNVLMNGLAQTTGTLLQWRVERGLHPEHPDACALGAHVAAARAVACGDGAAAVAALQTISERAYEEILAAI